MDENLLYKLALRLATFPGDPGMDNPQLIVGSMPQSLPINISFPAGSTILGSVVRSPRSLQILLDAPMSRDEVSDFYERELQAVGWHISENDIRAWGGGFVHKGFSTVDFLHYTHSSGAEITIQMSDGDSGITDLRLTLKQDESSQGTQARRQRRYGPDSYEVLPSLVPPRQSAQQSMGGGSGGDSANSSATLQLKEKWEIARLAKHYTDQLVQAGWTQVSGEQTEHTAWSAWTFRSESDEEWQAAFYLFQLPGEQIQYHLSLSAELKKRESQGGWFAQAPQA